MDGNCASRTARGYNCVCHIYIYIYIHIYIYIYITYHTIQYIHTYAILMFWYSEPPLAPLK